MAAANTNLLDVAKCGVCLDLYTDPRFLACGHTYCQACLDPTLHAIQGKVGKFYQCPECRVETKQTKAGLQKNYVARSMVDQIKTSSGSQDVGKCSGCRKTVVLGELFRCTTCKENSASAADAEIRVCGTCVAKSHKGHDYQELDVASKADFDEVREKIVGYKVANDAEKAVVQMRKAGILAAFGQLEKISFMLAERNATLTALKDEVDGSGALTKAQLSAKAQQAEKKMERGGIEAALVVLGEFSLKLAEIPSLQSASSNTHARDAEREEQAPYYVIEEITIPASPARASLRRLAPSSQRPARTSPRRAVSMLVRRASLRRQPSASPARQPSTSTSTASATGVTARRTAPAPSAPRMTARMTVGPIRTAPSRSGTNARRHNSLMRFGVSDDSDE